VIECLTRQKASAAESPVIDFSGSLSAFQMTPAEVID
jgi:hypothetical protein